MSQHINLMDLMVRVRGEYAEMPGLRLTEPQMCRLWAIDEITCEAVLQALTAQHFLSRTVQGAYVRAGDQA